MPITLGKLGFADTFMVIGYLLLMLGIGGYFFRRMRRMKDYFSGGNSIPWWLSGTSFYMSSFSVAAFVFYPGLCYRHGWVGVTLLWVAVPATIFSVQLFAVRWRRARIDSPVEYLETRYSSLLRQLFAWQGVPVRIIDDGIKLVATGVFVSVCVGMEIEYSIMAVGVIILLYTFMGGLWAVAITDFIQFVVLTAAILIILPLSISRAGGMTEIIQNVPEGFFRLTSEEFGWDYVLPLVLLYALAWSSINWSLIQRYYCVPNEKDAKKVGWFVAALYVVGPPIMFFPAIAATQFMPGIEDAGEVFPLLCTELLPAGMLGLAVAAMFAATMSSLSSDYNVCASVLTNDIYRRLIRPDAGEKELVLVGRMMTLFIGLVALGTAIIMSRMGKAEDLFKTMVTLFGVAASPVAVPMLVGLISRKMTNLAAITGFLAGTTVGVGLFVLSRHGENVELLGILWNHDQGKIFIGGFGITMEIFMFLSTTLVTLLAMMLANMFITKDHEAQARTDAFLKRLETPIGDLPEDQQIVSGKSAVSPFGIVGISILLIGVLMLCILPWVGGGSVFKLDALVGIALVISGGLITLVNRKKPDAA